MSTNSFKPLSCEQIKVVRTFYKALAQLRGETYIDPDEGLLECCSGTYRQIQENGGDPVVWAKFLTLKASSAPSA